MKTRVVITIDAKDGWEKAVADDLRNSLDQVVKQQAANLRPGRVPTFKYFVVVNDQTD